MSEVISAQQSIVGVMRAVSSVAKRERNEAQKFNFRGIDAVVNAIGPALREVGGAIIPVIIEKEYTRGVTRSGTPTVEAFLTVAFEWHGTDGGEPVRGIVAAEAMDTSDKATAKAMSVALRTFLLQTLMLPTDERDPDEDYHQRGTVESSPVRPVEAPADFDKALLSAYDLNALQTLWEAAVAGGYSDAVKSAVTRRKKEIQNG